MSEYLITWVGPTEGRLIKRIKERPPRRAYFLLESKTEDWVEFQEESYINIINRFGILFEGDDKAVKIDFDFNKKQPKDQYKDIFTKLYEIITDIRSDEENAKISIDVTAAPKTILLVFTLVATMLSNKKSKVKLLFIPKGKESIPMEFAPVDSEYYENHKDSSEFSEMSLNKYRKLEKEDEGGKPIEIELPNNNNAILNPINMKNFGLLALFTIVPSSDQSSFTSIELAENVFQDNIETGVYDGYFPPSVNKNGDEEQTTGDMSKPFKILIGKNLEKLSSLGLINLDKKGTKTYSANKSWGGYLISEAADNLYQKLKPDVINKNGQWK